MFKECRKGWHHFVRTQQITALKTRTYFLLLFIIAAIFSAQKAHAVDIFEWLEQPQLPLTLQKPEWLQTGSKIRFQYKANEYYKRWRENRLINDFSGNSGRLDLTLQLLPRFAFGFRKTIFEPQTWQNSLKDKTSRFDFESESQREEMFVRYNWRNAVLEFGGGSSGSQFNGSYELHRDVVNALGDNPPVYLNNRGFHHFARLYYEHKQFRFTWERRNEKYKHRLSATTPALDLQLNLSHEYKNDAIEVAWLPAYKLKPFIRYEKHVDTGSGDNFKDKSYRFGANDSVIKITSISLGSRFDWRKNALFAEYSVYTFKTAVSSNINLITINPLFLFGTNRVDYLMNFRPDDPWGVRVGLSRRYRGIDYSGQYSLFSMKGKTSLDSSKSYNMYASTSSENDRQRLTLDLHRLTISAKRPDRSGCWQIDLNLIAPVAEIEDIKEAVAAPPPPGPAPAKTSKPSESVRGGWQITIAREFAL